MDTAPLSEFEVPVPRAYVPRRRASKGGRVNVSTYLLVPEYEQLETIARSRNLSLSSAIRELILEKLAL